MAFKRKRTYVKRNAMPRRTGYRLRGRGGYRVSYAPRRRYLRGRGGYYFSGGAYASGKVPYLGKIGIGAQAGYSKGTYRGAKLSGLGAYNVSNIRHNVLIKPDIPEILNTYYQEGGTIIRHREYLGPIVTSDTAGQFKINSYALNPAQEQSFPWLAQIAAQYEEYKPNGLMFEFRSTASDAIASSTNLALGQVMMATQYDPTDPEFTSDIELLNYTWAQSGKVSDNIQHFVECDPKQSPLSHLYTRTGGPSDESDLRFSDFGRFSIATSGLQGTSVQIGQLWVTYEFIMFKPKLSQDQFQPGSWYHARNFFSVDETHPFGTINAVEFDPQNNIEIGLKYAGGNGVIVLPQLSKPTSFMISVSYDGVANNTIGPTFGATTDPAIHFLTLSKLNTDSQITTPEALTASQTNCTTITWITVDGDDQNHDLILHTDSLPSSSPNFDLYIVQIPYFDPSNY